MGMTNEVDVSVPLPEIKTLPSRKLLPEVFRQWFADRGWHPHRHQLEMLETANEGTDAIYD